MVVLRRKKVVFHPFKVALGWCAAARSADGICAFVLPVATVEAAEAELLRLRAGSRRGFTGEECLGRGAGTSSGLGLSGLSLSMTREGATKRWAPG